MQSEGNVVDDILKLIDVVRSKKTAQTTAQTTDAQSPADVLEDVHGSLCEILQKVIALPLHSRLHIVAPVVYTPPAEQQASIQQHLVGSSAAVAPAAAAGALS